MSEDMRCGFYGCNERVPVSLGRWFLHLVSFHRIDQDEALHLTSMRAA